MFRKIQRCNRNHTSVIDSRLQRHSIRSFSLMKKFCNVLTTIGHVFKHFGSCSPFEYTYNEKAWKHLNKNIKIIESIDQWIRFLAWNPPAKRYHKCAQYNHSRSSGERILTSGDLETQKKKPNSEEKAYHKEEFFLQVKKDLKIIDGSDFWLESSSAEGLHVRTV